MAAPSTLHPLDRTPPSPPRAIARSWGKGCASYDSNHKVGPLKKKVDIGPHTYYNTTMEKKRCNDCNEVLDLSSFNKAGYAPSGTPQYKAYCRQCQKKRASKYRSTHKEEIATSAADYHKRTYIPRPPKPIPAEKICCRCNILKPISEFRIVKATGRPHAYCHDCWREYARLMAKKRWASR